MPEETTGQTGDGGQQNDDQGQGQTGQTGGSTDNGRKGGEQQLQADLARERDLRQAAAKEAKRLEAELAKLREGSMSEQEKAVEQARREAREEAAKGFNARLVQAEVRAAAAGKLNDPEDAVRFLDLSEFDVDADGKVDTKAIAKALEGLLKSKPYLAASVRRPSGDADQGVRGSGDSSSMNDLLRRAAGR